MKMALKIELFSFLGTAQVKQGILFLLFPDRENTGNFAVTQGTFWRHRENILTVIINARNFRSIVTIYTQLAPFYTCVFTQYLSMLMHNQNVILELMPSSPTGLPLHKSR